MAYKRFSAVTKSPDPASSCTQTEVTEGQGKPTENSGFRVYAG